MQPHLRGQKSGNPIHCLPLSRQGASFRFSSLPRGGAAMLATLHMHALPLVSTDSNPNSQNNSTMKEILRVSSQRVFRNGIAGSGRQASFTFRAFPERLTRKPSRSRIRRSPPAPCRNSSEASRRLPAAGQLGQLHLTARFIGHDQSAPN